MSAAFAARLAGSAPGTRSALTMFGAPPGLRGDHDLNPGYEPKQPLRRAAVLVGLTERPGGHSVVLTRRTDTLKHHSGQVSFPGGRIEPFDPDPETAALREAEEEVGLAPSRVRIIGRLDTYLTRTGFEVVPVVAIVEADGGLTADPAEVAEIFDVPLAFVLDRGNHRRASRLVDGEVRYFWEMHWGSHRIWGATAGMLVNLAEILAPIDGTASRTT